MQTSPLDLFMSVYERHLANCVREMPRKYLYPIEDVPGVARRMRVALEKKSANINSPAFARTCKELGIKPTAKAIYQYIA